MPQEFRNCHHQRKSDTDYRKDDVKMPTTFPFEAERPKNCSYLFVVNERDR